MIDGTNPSRWSLPRKRILLRTLRSDPTQEYLLYIPEKGGENASMLVSVHGISRNAYEQAAAFADLCERQGYVLVVPVFTPEQHKDYQRLGRAGRGRRVDLLLHTILAEVGSLTGADVTQFRIFGFSGGAQFVHRYVMVHPQRVLAAVVAALTASTIDSESIFNARESWRLRRKPVTTISSSAGPCAVASSSCA